MIIQAEISGSDITGKLRFHGDHYEDMKVVEQLKQLNFVINEMMIDLEYLDRQTANRQEDSARRIRRELEDIKQEIKSTFLHEAETE